MVDDHGALGGALRHAEHRQGTVAAAHVHHLGTVLPLGGHRDERNAHAELPFDPSTAATGFRLK